MFEMEEVDIENRYHVEFYEADTSVDNYFDNFIDTDFFDTKCRECPRYGKHWRCPPHDRDSYDYRNRFNRIKLFAIQINFDDEIRKESFSSPQLNYIMLNSLIKENLAFREKLLEYEKEYGGECLYSGPCECEKCAREDNEPCRHPDKQRQTLSAMGANVMDTVSDFFDFELQWIGEDQKLPEYLTAVCALLYND